MTQFDFCLFNNLSPKAPDNTPDTAEPKQKKQKLNKKSNKDKSKGKKESNKRASFGHSSKGRGMLKSQNKEPGDGRGSEETPTAKCEYKGYDISMLPVQARPDPTKENRGLHSYTLRNASEDATIEVLLKHGAYFIKKVSSRGTGGVGQVSMKTHGAAAAWDMAKKRAGFDAK